MLHRTAPPIVATSAILLCALHAPAQPKPEPPPPDENLAAVANAYLANRESFTFFRCTFRYAVGSAASLEEAVAKGPTVNRLTADGQWVIDGKRIRYWREIDREGLAALRKALANPQGGNVAGQPGFFAEIPIDSLGYLTDGTRALRYDPDFVANLMGPARIEELIESLTPDATPWALGGMGRTNDSNPGRWILDGYGGVYEYKGRRELDGRAVHVVERKRETSTATYYFDPARGMLPVRRETVRTQGGDRVICLVTEARRCSGERWFPMRTLTISLTGGGMVRRVREIVVRELDADGRRRGGDFYLDLWEGIEVNHVDNLRTAFKLKAAKKIHADGLEALHVRCLEELARKDAQK